MVKQSLQELEKISFSPIYDIFMGQYHQRVMCSACDHINHTFPTFTNVQLTLPQSGNKPISIHNLLERFCRKETLQDCYNCDECKAKGVTAYKKTTFFRLPKVLVIQFVRFNWNGQKNSRFIDYPIWNFDMTKYVNFPQNDDEKFLYDLTAVTVHLGSTIGGHYWSISKVGRNYVKLDDERSTWISKKDGVVIGSSGHGATAYMLYYERKRY